MILGGANPVTPVQVADFINFAGERKIDISQVWLAVRADRIVWTLLPVCSPGRTALLFCSGGLGTTQLAADASVLIGRVSLFLRQRDVHLAQTLLDPNDQFLKNLFAANEFVQMAELIYLQGSTPRRPEAGAGNAMPAEFSLVEYSPATHPIFAGAILRTYQNSRDCPALTGMRDIEDVILGHKATGQFSPQWWLALCEGSEARGVLLLNRIPGSDTAELVYLGLTPEARRRGLGDFLMKQAWRILAQAGLPRLSLAVDAANLPALKLYYRHGMQRLTSKVAMLRDLRKLCTDPPQVR